jgi:adenosylcobinamide-GDP ribazoletransferase
MPVADGDYSPSARTLIAFPVVGIGLGLAWTVTMGSVGFYLASLPGATAVLIVDALLTGGLHLDAVADVGDGLGSRRNADEAVAVMRQPTVGAIGAATLILVLLARYSLIVPLVSRPEALLAVPVAGRAAMALLLARHRPREDTSLAAAFAGPPVRVLVGVLGLAALGVVIPVASQRIQAPFAGLIGLGAALLVALGFGLWWRARFGGLTGDGVGAGGLLAETAALAAITLLEPV